MMRKTKSRRIPCQTICRPTACRPWRRPARCTSRLCARERKSACKDAQTIAVTLLVITLLAALALFVRAKLQTLDKPLDAKTNQTAQAQPQKPFD
ncbi:MAG: hypothetical protein ACLR8U_09500 [Oscillospiraceae bacterium]